MPGNLRYRPFIYIHSLLLFIVLRVCVCVCIILSSSSLKTANGQSSPVRNSSSPPQRASFISTEKKKKWMLKSPYPMLSIKYKIIYLHPYFPYQITMYTKKIYMEVLALFHWSRSFPWFFLVVKKIILYRLRCICVSLETDQCLLGQGCLSPALWCHRRSAFAGPFLLHIQYINYLLFIIYHQWLNWIIGNFISTRKAETHNT